MKEREHRVRKIGYGNQFFQKKSSKEVTKKLRKKQKEYQDRGKKDRILKIGMLVDMQIMTPAKEGENPKLNPKFKGPYRIIAQSELSENAWKIKSTTGETKMVNAQLLKPHWVRNFVYPKLLPRQTTST